MDRYKGNGWIVFIVIIALIFSPIGLWFTFKATIKMIDMWIAYTNFGVNVLGLKRNHF